MTTGDMSKMIEFSKLISDKRVIGGKARQVKLDESGNIVLVFDPGLGIFIPRKEFLTRQVNRDKDKAESERELNRKRLELRIKEDPTYQPPEKDDTILEVAHIDDNVAEEVKINALNKFKDNIKETQIALELGIEPEVDIKPTIELKPSSKLTQHIEQKPDTKLKRAIDLKPPKYPKITNEKILGPMSNPIPDIKVTATTWDFPGGIGTSGTGIVPIEVVTSVPKIEVTNESDEVSKKIQEKTEEIEEKVEKIDTKIEEKPDFTYATNVVVDDSKVKSERVEITNKKKSDNVVDEYIDLLYGGI